MSIQAVVDKVASIVQKRRNSPPPDAQAGPGTFVFASRGRVHTGGGAGAKQRRVRAQKRWDWRREGVRIAQGNSGHIRIVPGLRKGPAQRHSSGKAGAKAAAWPLRPFTLGSRGGAHSGCVGAGTKAAVAATGRMRMQWGGAKSLAWRVQRQWRWLRHRAGASMKGRAVGGSAGHLPCTAIARLRSRSHRRGRVRRGRGVDGFRADLGDAGSGWSRGGAREMPPFVSTTMGESAGCKFSHESTRGSGRGSPLHPTSTGAEAVVGYRRRTKALKKFKELHAHREAARTWFLPVRGSLKKLVLAKKLEPCVLLEAPSASGMPFTTSYSSLLHSESFGVALYVEDGGKGQVLNGN
ncbi:hypothetical protein B0H19DRAFT_1237328 [Mycena capillaripes]|nr:hypothetical protein B0H19DRAFT_1237328 [Mycena capillaripes]